MYRFKCRYSVDIYRAFRASQVVIVLQIDLELRTVAEEYAEANRHLGGNRLLPIMAAILRNVVDLSCNALFVANSRCGQS